MTPAGPSSAADALRSALVECRRALVPAHLAVATPPVAETAIIHYFRALALVDAAIADAKADALRRSQ